MVTKIMFGSPEANAILERDRELQRRAMQEEPQGDSNQLADRLHEIEAEIESMEMEIAGLEDEASEIREKLEQMKTPDPKVGIIAMQEWNRWAKGTR